jgi:hypothetical protein
VGLPIANAQRRQIALIREVEELFDIALLVHVRDIKGARSMILPL